MCHARRATHSLDIGGIPDYPKRRLSEQTGHDSKRGLECIDKVVVILTTNIIPSGGFIPAPPQTHCRDFSACYHLPALRHSCFSVFHPRGCFVASFQELLELSHPISRRHWDLALRSILGWRAGDDARKDLVDRLLVLDAVGWKGDLHPCDNHHRNFVVFRSACTTD